MLSIQDAAAYYNVSPATIRRWIKAGKIDAIQKETSQGYEWRVPVPQQHDQEPDHQIDHVCDQQADQPLDRNAQVPDHNAQTAHYDAPHTDIQPDDHLLNLRDRVHIIEQEGLVKALELIDRLQDDKVKLAGQVGYLQRRVLELEEQVKMLTVDKEPEEETPTVSPEPEQPSETRTPLWQWVRRRLSRT